MTRFAPRLLLAALLLLLAACKVDLYAGLNERDANDMLAVLLRQGIPAEKVSRPTIRDAGGPSVRALRPVVRPADAAGSTTAVRPPSRWGSR